MAVINISHRYTNLDSYLIVRVVKHSAPAAEIERFAYEPEASPPYHPFRTTVFSNLDPVLHQVQFYRSADGDELTNLEDTHSVQPKQDATVSFINLEFEVDGGTPGLEAGDTGDPAAGTTEFRDARLSGYTFDVFQRGAGSYKKVTEIDIVDTGFDLLGGDQFSSGDTWWVKGWKNTNYALPVISSNQFSDIISINSTVNLTSSNWGRLHVCAYSGALGEVVFPAFSTIPDGTVIAFTTHGGSQKYLKLTFQAGNSIAYMGASHSRFYLAPGEMITMQFKGSAGYVTHYDGNYARRGNTYGDISLRNNTVYADGTEYSKAQVEGLYDWVLNGPSDMKTTYANWLSSAVEAGETVYPYKRMFAIDTGAETIRVPDWRNSFERYLAMDTDAERLVNQPGGLQADKNKKFWSGSFATLNILKVDGTNTEIGTDTIGPTSPNIRVGVPLEQNKFSTDARPVNGGKIPLIYL